MHRPLDNIFIGYPNLASDKYGCVGRDSAEIIFLSDIRWNRELIQWNEFPILLEGDVLHLLPPMNHLVIDVSIKNDVQHLLAAKNLLIW